MKILLLLLAGILGASSSFASHLMGGQITAKPLSGITYIVTMTLYRDVMGIPVEPTCTMTYEDLIGGMHFTRNPPSVSSPYINNAEEYVIIDTVTFPGPGTYKISYSNCCRNAAIINYPNGGSFYLYTIVQVDSVSPNSSPEFLNKPITLATLNNVWTYNPLPFDADGDSLAWHLIPPCGICPLILPHGDTLQPFTLDTLTGQITWMPDMLGQFIATIMVDEYRAGVKIGEVRREMQFIVTAMSGARATFATSTWPVNNDGNYQFELNASVPFDLNVVASDPDNSFLSLHPSGEPLLLSSDPAQAIAVINSNGIAQVDIQWTPTPSQVRSAPYLFVVRSNEDNPPFVVSQDITLLLHVNTVTGTPVHEVAGIGAMYPNLVTTEFTLPLTLAQPSKLELSIFNSLGQQAGVDYVYELGSGSQVVTINNLNLQSGLYYLRITDGENVSVQKFVSVNM